jgi:hypothetical protein
MRTVSTTVEHGMWWEATVFGSSLLHRNHLTGRSCVIHEVARRSGLRGDVKEERHPIRLEEKGAWLSTSSLKDTYVDQ